MNPTPRLVITPLSSLFNLPDYFNPEVSDKDRELISLKFMLYYNNSNFSDNAIPTLGALLTLGHLRLVVVDGYTEPVWFRARTVLASLIRNILPEKTTLKLLENNVKYIRAESENEMHENILTLLNQYEQEGYTVVNLFEDSWANYSRKEFPELYPINNTEEDNHH